MRITSLTITRWRNLENVHVDIPDDATLICLVGENGTGKSNILELLASCANALGLAPDVQLRRAPFVQDEHDFALTLRLPAGADLSSQQEQLQQYEEALQRWDRTLTYRASSAPTAEAGIRAGGVNDSGAAEALGGLIVNALQQQQEVNHLYIDADRAFNPVAIQDQEVWGLVRQDLRVPSYVASRPPCLRRTCTRSG
jgi:predicted ATP-dependent endonuclease of OLD family